MKNANMSAAMRVATILARLVLRKGYSVTPAENHLATVTSKKAAAAIINDGKNEFSVCVTTATLSRVFWFIPWIVSKLIVVAEIVIAGDKVIVHVSDNETLKLIQFAQKKFSKTILIHVESEEPEQFSKPFWPEWLRWAPKWRAVENEMIY